MRQFARHKARNSDGVAEIFARGGRKRATLIAGKCESKNTRHVICVPASKIRKLR